jgi:hypothetical protein
VQRQSVQQIWWDQRVVLASWRKQAAALRTLTALGTDAQITKP